MSVMAHMSTGHGTGIEGPAAGPTVGAGTTGAHWQVSQYFPFTEPGYDLRTGWRRSIGRCDPRRRDATCLPAP